MTSTRQEHHLRPGWVLWADWCTAVGRTSLDVTADALERYASQVSTPQLGDIRATCHQVGLPWPHETPYVDPWTIAEAGLLGLDESLARCPIFGWPTGFRGRRDAWLLVLTRGLRMSRRTALGVTVEDLTGIWSQLDVGTDPATCQRCVMTRWLEVVETQVSWSWSITRELLMMGRRPADLTEHACAAGLQLPTYAAGAEALAPRIDRHGGITLGVALSTRSLTQVVAQRCTTLFDSAVAVSGEDLAPPVEHGPHRSFDATTFERLEQACEDADEVNDRIAALLSETETQLKLV